MITAETTIGKIIEEKGEKAGEMMDAVFCDNEERMCCPGTSHQLGYAAYLKGKEAELPQLLNDLNRLPDL
jgi:hypothetical protein